MDAPATFATTFHRGGEATETDTPPETPPTFARDGRALAARFARSTVPRRCSLANAPHPNPNMASPVT